MEIIKYPKIPRIGSKKFLEFMDRNNIYDGSWEIYLSEKIDGANASVRKNVDGSISVYSRNQKLSPTNRLRGFYDYVQNNIDLFNRILYPNEIIYGEWLVPHRVEYDERQYNQFYAYNIYDINQDRMSLFDREIDGINTLSHVQLGYLPSSLELQKVLEFTSGERMAEGFVIKLINKDTKEMVMFKYINENVPNSISPKPKKISEEALLVHQDLGEIITEQWILKTIYKNIDEDRYSHDSFYIENMGKLIPITVDAGYNDLLTEHKDILLTHTDRMVKRYLSRRVAEILKAIINKEIPLN